MSTTPEPSPATVASFSAQGYSGPLSLLLELIEQRKVDITEVSLSEITEDYLRRISTIEWPDLEEASRFLVIAATLLFIKARVLSPNRKDLKPEPDDQDGRDPAELLVERLREYRLYRDAARGLRPLETAAALYFRRGRFERMGARWPGNPLEDTSPDDLFEIFKRVTGGNQQTFSAAPYEEVPLKDFMNSILGALKRSRAADFLKSLGTIKDRQVLIGSLLALLELARLGIVSINQAEPGQPIWMSLREGGAQVGPNQDEGAD